MDLREPRAAFARNAAALFAGQVATTALAIVLSAALGRTLGAHDFGIYYLITTTAVFSYVVAEWGQPLLVIREAARAPGRTGELLGSALVLRIALAAAVMVPAGLVSWLLDHDAQTTRLAVLLIAAMLPLSLAQAYGMVFRARDRMGREAAVAVSNKAILLCLTLPALAAGLGLPGVILAQALAGACALGLAMLLYRRLGAPPPRRSSPAVRELLAGGTAILAMSATIAVQPYLDVIILSRLVPPNVVGWFGAAKVILGTLTAPATILATAAYPRLVRAWGTPALTSEVRSALRPLLWLGALAGAGTYLFAGTVVGLVYGSAGFGPAAVVLQVFAPGFLLLFVDTLFGHVIYASGRGTAFAVAKIGSVVVGTVLNLLLVPLCQSRYGNGGIGVVAAFALSELVVFAGAVAALRGRALEPAMAVDVLRATGAAVSTVLCFRLLPPLPPWIAVPLCVAVFAAASLGFGLARPSDLDTLGAPFRGRLRTKSAEA